MDLINAVLIGVIGIALVIMMQRWLKSVGWIISNLDYECENCGGYIYLSPWQAVFTIRSMGRKWVRCPHCGQMTWAVPIRKG
jgi:hypothetical protein